ncbi:MAG: tRNA (adenosine(37)-N6)-threonylcarbamoyltransferase complex dimerization subunit type 1 TsaB [Lactobacillaceae bacterium]|jgi:tRNA threonylcarbamoyladenosine biosynthesis protein TsaB|nr:tRNA (adenosine(37)-N6)-threonylcarbamoyltransferase complex dimerization subunit type 1 TsaB [Lactobacillaceae bacterium]
MYILAFDTTASSCSVCLMKDNIEIVKTTQRMEFGQSEYLLPEIKKILDSIKKSFSDIGIVAVCVGPGSFTGVRASISAARAFGIADKNLPIIGVSAFDAYLYSLAPDELAEVNAVIIETKREDFYYQLFDSRRNKITEPSTAYRDEILSEMKGKKVTIIGDGVERFLATPSGLNFNAIKMEMYPPVNKIALCAEEKQKNGIGAFPKPLYLRAPDICRCG